MQHHPLVASLRIVGFVAGFFLFVFMALHFGEGARDPVYVKGKPSLQWLAVSSEASPASASTAQMSRQVAATPVASTPVSSTTSTSSQKPTEVPPSGKEAASQPEGQAQKAEQPAKVTPQGKSLGREKQAQKP